MKSHKFKAFCRLSLSRLGTLLPTCFAISSLTSLVVRGGDLGLATDFQETIVEHVKRAEYEIRWQEGVGAWQSPNRAQNLRFTFSDAAFRAEPRLVADEEPWSVSLHLAAVGRRDSLRPVPERATLEVAGRIARMSIGDLTIEYFNDENGLRQNFILNDRPAGTGPIGLTIDVRAQGAFMRLDSEEQAVIWQRETGEVLMGYLDLNVWDATERSLEAWFESGDPDRFVIVVDDADAVYPLVIDPLTIRWTKVETQLSANFGYSVAGVGNVGSADSGSGGVLVGAPYFDTGLVNAGKVFVFFSATSSPPPTSPTWTKEGDQANAYLGMAVADAKDVNGDGYADIIVGAPYYDGSGYYDNGRVYVYAGGSSNLGSTPLWQRDGAQSAAHFGMALAVADVNYDSYWDVIIGAPDYSWSYSGCGAVFVHHGSSTGPSSSANWWKAGLSYAARYGTSVAGGNVNGDFYDDVLVGAPTHDSYGVRGAAYLYLGSGSGLVASPATTWTGGAAGDYFGQSVALPGKRVLNSNPSYGDVLIGAPSVDAGQPDEGKVYLYLGTATGAQTSPSWTDEGNEANARCGYSVAGGDIEKAAGGYAEVLIGVPYKDSLGNTDGGEGRYYRNQSGSLVLDTLCTAPAPNSYAGFSVTYTLNLYYGQAGIIVGAPGHQGYGGAQAYTKQ